MSGPDDIPGYAHTRFPPVRSQAELDAEDRHTIKQALALMAGCLCAVAIAVFGAWMGWWY